MSVETNEDVATEGATVQDSQDSVRQRCEKHGSVSLVQDGTERCATVQDAGSCCSSVEVKEGALVSNRGSFNIMGVSGLMEMSELGDQLLSSQ